MTCFSLPEKASGPATQSEPNRAVKQRVKVVFFIRRTLSRLPDYAQIVNTKRQIFHAGLEIILANPDCVLSSQAGYEITGPVDQDHCGVFAYASHCMEHHGSRGTACWNGCLSRCAAEGVVGAQRGVSTHSVGDRERRPHSTMYRANDEVRVLTGRNVVRRREHVHLNWRRTRRPGRRWS